MKVTMFDPRAEKVLGTASTARAVEALLKKNGALDLVEVRFDLGMPLSADVIRVFGEPETVVLGSGGIEHWIERSVGDDNDTEKLGVSCNPRGDVVSVSTINLEFRPVDDEVTDRGIVWVQSGESASAKFILRPGKAKDFAVTPFDVIQAASGVVREKIVNRFLN